jgi:hypothetical protein
MTTLFALFAASVLATIDDPVNIGVTWRVYYGTNSGAYTHFVSTTNLQTQIHGLNSGTRYYFAASARGASGDESPFSPEVAHLTALVPPRLIVTNFTQAAMKVGGPWTNVAMHVVEIPDGYQFSRVEIKPGVR